MKVPQCGIKGKGKRRTLVLDGTRTSFFFLYQFFKWCGKLFVKHLAACKVAVLIFFLYGAMRVCIAPSVSKMNVARLRGSIFFPNGAMHVCMAPYFSKMNAARLRGSRIFPNGAMQVCEVPDFSQSLPDVPIGTLITFLITSRYEFPRTLSTALFRTQLS